MIRRIAIVVGLLAWVYSWWLFWGVRSDYEAVPIGSMPGWLIATLAVTTTSLIGGVVVAGMRFEIWPLLTLAGGVALAASIIGSQFGVMSSIASTLGGGQAHPTIAVAFEELLRTRSSFEIVVASALPTLLVLAGLTGLAGLLFQSTSAEVPV